MIDYRNGRRLIVSEIDRRHNEREPREKPREIIGTKLFPLKLFQIEQNHPIHSGWKFEIIRAKHLPRGVEARNQRGEILLPCLYH